MCFEIELPNSVLYAERFFWGKRKYYFNVMHASASLMVEKCVRKISFCFCFTGVLFYAIDIIILISNTQSLELD